LKFAGLIKNETWGLGKQCEALRMFMKSCFIQALQLIEDAQCDR
jgi:hypothetical protein